MWQVVCWCQTRLWIFYLHIQAINWEEVPSASVLHSGFRLRITICQFLLWILRKTTLVLKRLVLILFCLGFFVGCNFHGFSPASKWGVLPGHTSLGVDVFSGTVDLGCWSWSNLLSCYDLIGHSGWGQDSHPAHALRSENVCTWLYVEAWL